MTIYTAYYHHWLCRNEDIVVNEINMDRDSTAHLYSSVPNMHAAVQLSMVH
jgi:hypothetical protein